MKTDHLIKAIGAIIVLTVVMSIHPLITKALNNVNSDGQLLEIPSNNIVLKNPVQLKLEINKDELRKIREEKKRQEELQRQKEEEERRLEEERTRAEEEARRQEELQKEAYNGLSLGELSDKLNRSLNSTISGKGELFAKLSVEYGVDPYLAVAIVMLETGCKWDCSNLLKTCNNVGGMKGAGGCGGGEYASFPSLDEGIESFMSNLNRNYLSYGLTTPETMGPKYAASPTWAAQVRSYMNEIEAK